MNKFPKVFYLLTRLIFTPLGFLTGIFVFDAVRSAISFFNQFPSEVILLFYFIASLIFAVVFFFLGPLLCAGIFNLGLAISQTMKSYSSQDIVCACLGFIAGLLVSALIGNIYNVIQSIPIKITLNVLTYLIFGFLGIIIGVKYLRNVLIMPETNNNTTQKVPKILDTSALIDGRVLDVVKTGFLAGPFVVPSFVLDELRRMADTEDLMKRNKGRRGLDMISALQSIESAEVKIDESFTGKDREGESLLKMAKHLKGAVVTTDYNLNKVAQVKNITVLNINDLNNAIKPSVIPGDKLILTVLKEGKEQGQGLAYLPDGTMIVVENGKDFIGKEAEITVTTSLQTSAGRIIFGRVL